MFNLCKGNDRITGLSLMVESVKAMLEGESDLIAALANVSAALKFYLDDVNWVGFYLLKGTELVLGPFQGLPACVRIAWGKGVCGKAASDGKTVVVPDVHNFPGHITCDSASASEIVVPLFRNGKLFGVLDADSPRPGRFTEFEVGRLEQVCAEINTFLGTVELPVLSFYSV